MAVSPWNQWVEAQGGEGVATVARVKAEKLDCYLEGYRYRVCRSAGELAEELKTEWLARPNIGPLFVRQEELDGKRARVRFLATYRKFAFISIDCCTNDAAVR